MKIFLDVGAHKGQTASAVLEDSYGFEKIYCFEPVPGRCDSIRKIGNERIIANEFGLWKKTTTKNIFEPGSIGASIFKDKFTPDKHPSIKIKLVRASEWFAKNIKPGDEVYMKLNCEGSECDILDDLLDSGEYKKLTALMVDFDVRKIPSQKHREKEVRVRLEIYPLPVVYIMETDDNRKWSGKHREFTHYWIEKCAKEVINLADIIDESSIITHVPLLVRVFDLSKGDVLEVGTGYFSTLLLHWLSSFTHRVVYSYESRAYWYNRAKRLEGLYHHIVYAPDWDKADFGKKHWGMVFIDHGPDARRVVEIERLANKTDYMVIHDTDPKRDKQYGYSVIYPLFKYRYDYKKVVPWTTVVSNTKKLDNIA